MERERSALVMVDFQARLMPAIDGGEAVLANARRLARAAALLDVPALWTEQNPRGLGPTVDGLKPDGAPTLSKMTFDATAAPGFDDLMPDKPDVVVAGCEAHVCALGTALGLLARGRRVYLAADAVGSRRPDSKAAALERAARAGAVVVTAEMALFEWLGTAEHPRFKEVVALVK